VRPFQGMHFSKILFRGRVELIQLSSKVADAAVHEMAKASPSKIEGSRGPPPPSATPPVQPWRSAWHQSPVDQTRPDLLCVAITPSPVDCCAYCRCLFGCAWAFPQRPQSSPPSTPVPLQVWWLMAPPKRAPNSGFSEQRSSRACELQPSSLTMLHAPLAGQPAARVTLASSCSSSSQIRSTGFVECLACAQGSP
jgi:hypothetical protein